MGRDSTTREIAVGAVSLAAEAVLNTPGTLKKIADLCRDASPAIRCAGAMAIGAVRQCDADMHAVLADILHDDVEDASSLPSVMSTTCRRLKPQYRIPKCAALKALGMLGATWQLVDIVDDLNHHHWEVRLCALQALKVIGGTDHASCIADLLEDDAFRVRGRACKVLGALGASQCAAKIAECLEDESHTVRTSALIALARFGEQGIAYNHQVFKLLKDRAANVQIAAMTCLVCFGGPCQSYAGVIASKCNSDISMVRMAAVESLAEMGAHGGSFAEVVHKLKKDAVPDVRRAAERSFLKMTSLGTVPAYFGEEKTSGIVKPPSKFIGQEKVDSKQQAVASPDSEDLYKQYMSDEGLKGANLVSRRLGWKL